MPLASDVSLDDLADRTEMFSGADIEALCREAAMIALRQDLKTTEVTSDHFSIAMEGIRASLTDDVLKYYQNVSKNLGSGVAKKDKRDKDIQYM
jgi:transitional endoplasmic reticulum ATPase